MSHARARRAVRRDPPRENLLHRADQRNREIPQRRRPGPAPRPQGQMRQRLPPRRPRGHRYPDRPGQHHARQHACLNSGNTANYPSAPACRPVEPAADRPGTPPSACPQPGTTHRNQKRETRTDAQMPKAHGIQVPVTLRARHREGHRHPHRPRHHHHGQHSSLTSGNTVNLPETEPCRTVDPAVPGTTRRPSACPPEGQLPAVTKNRNYPQPVKHPKPAALAHDGAYVYECAMPSHRRIGCVGVVARARPVAARVHGRWMPGTSGVHGRSIRSTSSSGRSLSCWLGG